ncbi:isopenicillin N synthase family dioxygenase [Erythrobacter aureus]|jgi:isopenicillin N synthase-like dioxygenase|uniref:2-oxoglutarate-dependent ethylene/succinate-forming enzyme n=1 Tax=Erythrobacter aureus TaxID=2182384 RepID=A0A345YHE9_9SPHN|nr:2-oxoglutarate and iron-dependent oxygenase domain-containing protein [Erythrobacter aureus]AXK43351.1 isopenicillin N synthase family oxygenase [Erythrobacter aureus]MBL45442.1 flavonol synthase [Sphingomonadaceae bacterium]MBQ95709.1 flavonol synthase [Actinomycetota bacterium]|tara:strand:+ start:254 stop:1195 length:942 start_codon:yes stop_codon:yes gene_type:complete
MTDSNTDIAVVSLAQPLDSIADELGRSFREYGFAVIRDHGIPQDLIDRAEALSKEFFALPAEVKKAYHIPGGGGARGYTPFGTEKAKDAKVHDLKEFWHVGRELPEGHELSEYMADNVWPSEVEGFRETFTKLYSAFEEAGGRVLEGIALHLGLDRTFFAPTVEDGNSVMRLLRYPPLEGEEAEGAIRAAAHGDINTITLLLGAEEAGLELLTRQGDWKAVDVPEGALVINVGDMLDRLTNGKLRSTTHRVVNPRGQAAYRARYSMPFFLHFRPDYMIETLPSCIDPQAPDDHPAPISSHEFLLQRLREINLA